MTVLEVGTSEVWSDPPVPAALDGFYKDRILRGVAQRIAQSFDGAADGTVKIDKNILRPKRLPEFFARHHFIRPAEQDSERAKG